MIPSHRRGPTTTASWARRIAGDGSHYVHAKTVSAMMSHSSRTRPMKPRGYLQLEDGNGFLRAQIREVAEKRGLPMDTAARRILLAVVRDRRALDKILGQALDMHPKA